MQDCTGLFKVLSDNNRIRIINLLERRPLCVCEIAHILGVTQPSISRHLRKMKSAGLVHCAQDSLWTNYLLKTDRPAVKALLQMMKRWGREDPVLKKDCQKLKKVDRRKLCLK